MKVVWLFPPAEKGGFPNISQYRFYKRMPIRISIIYPYLAAMGATLLKNASFDVEFLDAPTMDLTWKDVDKDLQDADLVVMETRTPNLFEIQRACLRIKMWFPDVKVAFYGDHVSWNPNESLSLDVAPDYIVCGGDYDRGVLDLAKAIEAGYKIPRAFQFPMVEDLDILPFCDRNLVPWRLYYESWRHRENFVWTMSQRGCYYHCSFCAWVKTFWNYRLRHRSPHNVVDEYESIYEELGECEVLDDADLFDTTWGVKFAKELISRGYDNGEILWAIQTHPNMIRNLEDLKILRRSGLRTVKLGIESGNQITLNRIRKGTTVKQIEKAVSLLKETRIMVHANLMVGFPWETKEMAYHTIDWIKKLDPNQAQFSLLIPYPNTEIFDQAKENGWLLVAAGEWDKFDASKPMLKMEGLTPEEIVTLYKDHWRSFYLNPKYVWRHLVKVRSWYDIKQLYRGFRSIYFGHMRSMDLG